MIIENSLPIADSTLPLECHIDISIDDKCWLKIDSSFHTWFEKIVTLTMAHILKELKIDTASVPSNIEISALFTDDDRIQILNRDFRSKDSPTNVLSFPDTELSTENLVQAVTFEEPLLLGDIVLAEETINREACEQNKSVENHLAHLIVHGLLHLAGYDHVIEEEAEIMEEIEIRILEKMHIANPYQVDPSSEGAFSDTK